MSTPDQEHPAINLRKQASPTRAINLTKPVKVVPTAAPAVTPRPAPAQPSPSKNGPSSGDLGAPTVDRRSWMVLGGAAAAVVLAGGLLVTMNSGGDGTQAGAAPTTVTVTATAETSDPVMGTNSSSQATDDSPSSESTSERTTDQSTTEESTSQESTSGTTSDETSYAPDGSVQPSDDAGAVASMSSIRDTDKSVTSLDGSWAAQISSQYVGVEDRSIQSTPFTALDIFNRYESLKQQFSDRNVVLLKQNDFGKIVTGGPEIWVTLVLVGAGSRDEINTWCASQFPGKTGTDLQNLCLPRQMVQPYSG